MIKSGKNREKYGISNDSEMSLLVIMIDKILNIHGVPFARFLICAVLYSDARTLPIHVHMTEK